MQSEIKALKEQFENYGLKRNSAIEYARHIHRFCNKHNITPNDLLEMPIEKIEDMTEDFIRSHRRKYSPKELNVYYSSIKAFLVMNRKIKSTRMFRQIKFDATKRSTRDTEMITDEIMRKACDAANLTGKLVLTLYGINGLRPSLIPQLKFGDIDVRDVKRRQDGTVELMPKTWIWVKAEYEGNKAEIDFPIILTDEQRKWLQEHLNERIRNGEVIDKQSQLVKCGKSRHTIKGRVKRLLKKVGFNGRTYLLRHYAYKRMKQAVNDYLFLEWLMGHQSGVPATYDHGHYLSDNEIAEYKAQYDQSKLLIYGATTKEIRQAEMLAGFARNLGVSDDKIIKILELLKSGQLTTEQFEQRLNQIVQKHLEQQIEDKFEELFVKLNRKYNGGETK